MVNISSGFGNGKISTQTGEVSVAPSGEWLNLYIRGPRGGLRHWLIMSREKARELAEEILLESYMEEEP